VNTTYALGSYAPGYCTPPLAPGEGPEIVGPEFALGRGDRSDRLGSEDLLEKLNTTIQASGEERNP